jgi:hypothetical protein
MDPFLIAGSSGCLQTSCRSHKRISFRQIPLLLYAILDTSINYLDCCVFFVVNCLHGYHPQISDLRRDDSVFPYVSCACLWRVVNADDSLLQSRKFNSFSNVVFVSNQRFSHLAVHRRNFWLWRELRCSPMMKNISGLPSCFNVYATHKQESLS